MENIIFNPIQKLFTRCALYEIAYLNIYVDSDPTDLISPDEVRLQDLVLLSIKKL